MSSGKMSFSGTSAFVRTQSYLLRSGRHIAVPGERVPALRVRPLGPAVAAAAGPRRRDRRAVRGRLHRGIPAPGGRRAVSGGASRASGEVRAGAALREDAAAGVRPVRGREPAARRPGEAGDVRLPGLHAYLREEEERTVHGGTADDPDEGAGEAQRGEGRAAATLARPDSGGGGMVAVGRRRAPAVLRGPDEWAGPGHVLFPGGATLVPCPEAAQPDRPAQLGADAAAPSALAPPSPHPPPLSSAATWRCHPRQEPSAVVPHAGICGGGYGQP